MFARVCVMILIRNSVAIDRNPVCLHPTNVFFSVQKRFIWIPNGADRRRFQWKICANIFITHWKIGCRKWSATRQLEKESSLWLVRKATTTTAAAHKKRTLNFTIRKTNEVWMKLKYLLKWRNALKQFENRKSF